jgi:transposase
MVFREVSVIEIREVLRSWLAGAGLRTVAAQAGVDRKTARRYVEAAVAAGLARDGGPGQLSDELVGQVAEAVRPVRPGGHGQGRDRLESCREEIQAWVKQGLTVVKIGVLLERQGVAVPYRTLHRYCTGRCGYGRSAAMTVRVADGEPGAECQLDFGYLGLLADPVSGRQRKVHALIFTACYSRHMFVWLSFTQTLAAFLAGSEAAWAFFGGVFQVLVPDNASAIVADADAVNPRFTAGWLDYMQATGFVTDAARVRSPKPRVAYCTSSGRFVASSDSGWSDALGAAADLRPVGRVVGVGRVVEELSFVVIAGAGDNPGSAPGLDGVVVDAVGGGGFGEGEHAGVAEALAAAA